ncbi:MAG: arylesterase [Hydrogenophaga sp.]|nr:arylesterase [Hydrogenophaga sp.]
MKRRHFNALALAGITAGLCAQAHAQAAGAQAKAPTSNSQGPAILIVGDSLSAEYGLQRGRGWVALLQQKLAAERLPSRVINASISGDTTAGGRSRLPSLLRQHQPAVVVIELGGNDALRGLPLDMTRDNLSTMARVSREAGARVLIVGMEMPPNYGARYAQEFRQIFSTVAKAEQAALVPFFLAGVADGPEPLRLFQTDRIHPNEDAQPIMLANVWPALRPLIPR